MVWIGARRLPPITQSATTWKRLSEKDLAQERCSCSFSGSEHKGATDEQKLPQPSWCQRAQCCGGYFRQAARTFPSAATGESIDEPVDRSIVADLDALAVVLARQKPAWEPGTRQGYHGLTLGFYQGELIRRIDPQHRTLGRFFHEEIAVPLGLDAYINVPVDLPNSRPASGIGYGYVTSQAGTTVTGDPRDLALRDALYTAISPSNVPGRHAA